MELFLVILVYLHDYAPSIFKGIIYLGILFVLCMVFTPWILLLFPLAIIILIIRVVISDFQTLREWRLAQKENEDVPSTPSETNSQTPPNPRP